MFSAHTEAFARCVSRLLEEAAFVFTEPVESGIPLPPFSGPVLEARVQFWGKEAGEIRVYTDEQLAVELAANLLGEEPGDPTVAQRGQEALGELANIIAGSLVVDLYGDQERCRISVPVIRTLGNTFQPSVASQSACSVVLITEEGHRLDATLQTAASGE